MRRLALPLLILSLAAALRFCGLDTQEIWLDEAASWHTANSSDLVEIVLPNNTPPLYYALLRGWTVLFGNGRGALRSLSAVEGTLFVGAVMWLAGILFDRRTARWSGLWAAVAVMAVYYSQEARAYSQLTLLLTITYGCIATAVKTERLGWWAAAAAGAGAAVYTHYLAPLALLFALSLIALNPSARNRRRLAVTAGIVVIAWAPWLLAAAMARPASTMGMTWIADIWHRTPPAMAIPLSLDTLILGAHADLLPANLKQLSSIDFPASLHLIGIGGLLLLGLAAVAPGDALGPQERRWKWAVVALLVGPLMLLWGLSWLQPLYVVGRYDQLALPAYPVLLGLGCARLQARRPLLCAGAAALLLVPIGWKLFAYYAASPTAGTQRTAGLLDARVRDGDVVIFTELRALPVLYELGRSGYSFDAKRCRKIDGSRSFACRAYPRETEQLMGTWSPLRVAGDAAEVRADALDFAADRGNDSSSVWIVLGHYKSARGRLAATEISAALLRELENLGLRSVAGYPRVGILEYRGAAP